MIEATADRLYNTFKQKSLKEEKENFYYLGVGNKCKDVQTTNFCIDK